MKLVLFAAHARRSNAGSPLKTVRGRAPERPGRRLAAIGALVMALGLVAAGLVYWLETRRADPSMDELLPGYSRANSRQMGIFYGQLGQLMWQWREDLLRPGTHAAIIVLVAGLVAIGCFRAAWEEEDSPGPTGRRPGSGPRGGRP